MPGSRRALCADTTNVHRPPSPAGGACASQPHTCGLARAGENFLARARHGSRARLSFGWVGLGSVRLGWLGFGWVGLRCVAFAALGRAGVGPAWKLPPTAWRRSATTDRDSSSLHAKVFYGCMADRSGNDRSPHGAQHHIRSARGRPWAHPPCVSIQGISAAHEEGELFCRARGTSEHQNNSPRQRGARSRTPALGPCSRHPRFRFSGIGHAAQGHVV